MTNHDEPWRNHDGETSRTMTNHDETMTVKHHEPWWTMTKPWQWNITNHDETMTVKHHEPWRNHDSETSWTTMNHDETMTEKHHEPSHEPWRTMTKYHEPRRNITNHDEPPQNHHEPSQSLIQNEIWYWILDSDWLNSGSHDIFLRILEKNYPDQSWTTTWTMTYHDETSRTMTKHHEPWRTTTNHHETTTNHHEVSFKMRFDTESWTLIG